MNEVGLDLLVSGGLVPVAETTIVEPSSSHIASPSAHTNSEQYDVLNSKTAYLDEHHTTNLVQGPSVAQMREPKSNSCPSKPSVRAYDTVVIDKSCNIEGLNNGCKSIPALAASSSLISPPGESGSSLVSLDPPNFDLNFGPHSPPFDQSTSTLNNPNVRTLRERVINNNSYQYRNNLNFTASANLQHFMEERLARWRPSESHQSVDASMNGTHPYQTREIAGHSVPIMTKLRNWWTGEPSQQQDESDISIRNESQIIELPEDYIRSLNLSNILQRAHPHSSDSFVVTRTRALPLLELDPIANVEYTPRAIPFNNFDLNFEKSPPLIDTTRIHLEEGNEEVYDLIGGMDNFLVSCLNSAWRCIKSIHC